MATATQAPILRVQAEFMVGAWSIGEVSESILTLATLGSLRLCCRCTDQDWPSTGPRKTVLCTVSNLSKPAVVNIIIIYKTITWKHRRNPVCYVATLQLQHSCLSAFLPQQSKMSKKVIPLAPSVTEYNDEMCVHVLLMLLLLLLQLGYIVFKKGLLTVASSQ